MGLTSATRRALSVPVVGMLWGDTHIGMTAEINTWILLWRQKGKLFHTYLQEL